MNAAYEVAHLMEDIAENPEDETDAAKVKSEVVDPTENTVETLEDGTGAAKVELEVADLMDTVDVDLKTDITVGLESEIEIKSH